MIEHIDVHNVRVNGAPSTFDHSSAYAQWGDVMVELICQHDSGGERIVGASGIHHVAFFVDDFATAAAQLAAAGHARGAVRRDGRPAWRSDSTTGGPSTVTSSRSTSAPTRLARFYDMVRDASAGWDGSDPIRSVG